MDYVYVTKTIKLKWQEKLFSVLLSLISMMPSISYSRWANDNDAASSIETQLVQFGINKDGSYSLTVEKREKVLKESGRTQVGTLRWSYSPSRSSLRVLEAKTINDGREVSLDSKYIEDKAIALAEHGFDNQNQLVCAFNDIRIGSIIASKIKLTVHKPSFAGIFSDRQILGDEVPLKSGQFIYTSAIPIYIEANDPDHSLEIVSNQINDRFIITVNVKAKIFKKVVDEDAPLLNFSKKTWFVVSSSKSYSDIASSVVDRYEAILSAPLPPAFEKILALAKEKKSILDQIDMVTSELARIMRYVGDWRQVDGGYIPRPLSVVEKSLFGDCKDFSAVTTAILRRLNIEANIAFVERGQIATPLPNLTFDAFNHAIISVKLGNERLWIDPTNLASFARGTFEDILDRKALVISKANSRLYEISSGSPTESLLHKSIHYKMRSDNTEDIHLNTVSKGRQSIDLAGLGLYYSNEKIENLLLGGLADDILDHKTEPFDLTSRIVSDIKLQIWVRQKSHPIKTTSGPGLRLKSLKAVTSILSLQLKNRVSDYFLMYPTTLFESRTLSNISLLGKDTPSCNIDSSWMSASRKLRKHSNGITITDEAVVKRAVITNDEMQSPEFLNFRSSLKKCFEDQYVIYKLGSDELSLRKPAASKVKSK